MATLRKFLNQNSVHHLQVPHLQEQVKKYCFKLLSHFYDTGNNYMLLPTKSSKYNQVWRHMPEILAFRRLGVGGESNEEHNIKLTSPSNSFVEVSGIEPGPWWTSTLPLSYTSAFTTSLGSLFPTLLETLILHSLN